MEFCYGLQEGWFGEQLAPVEYSAGGWDYLPSASMDCIRSQFNIDYTILNSSHILLTQYPLLGSPLECTSNTVPNFPGIGLGARIIAKLINKYILFANILSKTPNNPIFPFIPPQFIHPLLHIAHRRLLIQILNFPHNLLINGSSSPIEPIMSIRGNHNN